MEQQNDERLESLYSKINSIKNVMHFPLPRLLSRMHYSVDRRALRIQQVTIDIHSDSQSQNRLLNQTVESPYSST
jgi:hypothetical protein